MDLTAANTAIVVDSTADFPQAPERYPNWRIVPLYVRFGQESFRDYVELGPADFYTRLRSSAVVPTTSQPTPGDFHAAYQELGAYERVYSLHIAGTLSGTVESARAAAAEFGDRIRVVDTETASAAVAMLGLAIQRRLERGTTDEEVEELVGRHRRESQLIFTLDTLDYLARGGRIGRAAAWAGGLMRVKPILTIRDGEVIPIKRVRGNQRAFQEFIAAFESGSSDGPGLRVAAADARAAASGGARPVARHAAGCGPVAARQAGEARPADGPRPARAPAARLPAGSRGDTDLEPVRRGGGGNRRRGAAHLDPPDPTPVDRSEGRRPRRERRDLSGLVQPALARRQAAAWDAAALAWTAAPERVPRPLVRPGRRGRDRRLRARVSRERGGDLAAPADAGRERAPGCNRLRRLAPRRVAGARAVAAPLRRARCIAPPTRRRRGRVGAAQARAGRAPPAAGWAGADPRGDGGGDRTYARRAGRARGALPRGASVRADEGSGAGDRGDRRRSRGLEADAAAAPGRCRLGQDRRRPLRAAAGRRSRQDRRADGADGNPG